MYLPKYLIIQYYQVIVREKINNLSPGKVQNINSAKTKRICLLRIKIGWSWFFFYY